MVSLILYYKNTTHNKLLVCVTPNGVIFPVIFMGGRILHKQQVASLLDLLEPGDTVVADRRFDIHSTR